MEKTKDRNSIFIVEGKDRYKIVAPPTSIPRTDPEAHAGKWEAIVTIYWTSNDKPPKAQSFPEAPQYGATEDEARSKGHAYGRKLVCGDIAGLKIGPSASSSEKAKDKPRE